MLIIGIMATAGGITTITIMMTITQRRKLTITPRRKLITIRNPKLIIISGKHSMHLILGHTKAWLEA